MIIKFYKWKNEGGDEEVGSITLDEQTGKIETTGTGEMHAANLLSGVSRLATNITGIKQALAKATETNSSYSWAAIDGKPAPF